MRCSVQRQCGGLGGEGGVAVGGPAHAGVLPRLDHQRRLLLVDVALVVTDPVGGQLAGQRGAQRVPGPDAPVVPCPAQRGQGGGVAAGFGGEVAAEPERRPAGAESPIGAVRLGAVDPVREVVDGAADLA